jgi:peptidoglycan lytic transglycosylase
MRRAVVVLVAVALGCATRPPAPVPPSPPPPARPAQEGTASWYGAESQGQRTADGERFDERSLTAASPSLPIGTRARVTNVANGRSVVVRINDRGPNAKHRVIDLSYAAARALGMVGHGTARVRVEVVEGEPPPS